MQIQKYALALLVSSSLSAAFVFPSTRTSFGLGQSRSCSVIFSEVGNEIAEASPEGSPEAATEVPVIENDVSEEVVADATSDESTASTPVEDSSESEAVVEATETVTSDEGSEETTPAVVVPPAPKFTVYISNLPYTSVEKDIEDLFSEFGEVRKVTVPMRKTDDGCRGFAFIDMATEEEMEKAIEEVNARELGGRVLTAKKSLPKERVPKQKKRETRVTPERLYLGNLPYGVTEQEIRDLFSENADGVGVTDMFLVKDSDGKDRGFGFVTLENEESVQPTIDSLDGFVFSGRRLAVRRPNPEGVKGVGGKGKVESQRIYFGNLSFDTTTATVRTLFEEHGTVLNLYVNEDYATKASRGYGFAQMPKEDAEKAIEALNGVELEGRELKVCIAAEKVSKLRIYVGSLSFDTDEDAIRSIFEEYGEVFSVILPQDSSTGGTRGFSIITMPVDAGKLAIKELDGLELDGRTIQVNEAQPKGFQSSTTKLYIGNLDFDTPEEAVRDIFADYGEVKSCVLPEDKDFGGSRGFGFVTMEKESAQSALAELDGVELDGRNIRVSEADGGRNNKGNNNSDGYAEDNSNNSDGYAEDGNGEDGYAEGGDY